MIYDEAGVRVAAPRSFEIEPDRSRQQALDHIRAARWKLPPNWKFDRDDANAR